MRLRGIGTRYAAWIAGLALALVALALAVAGSIAFQQSRVVQEEIRQAVAAASRSDEDEALRRMATYLGGHLFNALYQLDVERLGEHIEQTRGWLPVTIFLVIDREGRILTDGTSTNERYGDAFPEALPGHGTPDIQLIRQGESTELRFVIASGGVTAGWGVVGLRQGPWQVSLRGLEGRTAATWRSHRASLLTLGAGALVVTLALGILTAVLLSRTLARPLTEMSRAAAEIAAGELDRPLTLDSPDELGDLARALNRMARDLRAHEAALRAERADLAAKNAELERFAYTVSHDLKTPLVTIRGFAGLAGTDLAAGDVGRVRQDLGRIVAAADKMHRLLDDILELSRIGRVVNPPQDVPLADVVREALEIVRGQLSAKGVVVDVSPGLPVVRADRKRLVEVFQNLLENGAKFAGEGQERRIEVGMRDGAGKRVFFVRDNGQGIDPRFLDRVFNLFEKLDASAEGTGVGLALVRRIVEAHGGRAWAESDGPGRGSTFCFTLPSPGPADAQASS